MRTNNKRGFTLLEILIAVLIIGILVAIALPQYQRAVLKSRFAALIPIAKSMADSNEAYYLEHGEYAEDAEDLPVQGRMNYPDGTTLEFGTSSDYAYVLASNPSVAHNTYVVYQKHSKNFADNTHCEAFTADEQANQVCQSFGGTPLDGSLGGEDYTAYLLSGNNSGTFAKECKGPFATEKACPSGCGVMTRDSAGCNTATGQWTEEGFDEEDCPKPLGTDTENCPAGYLGQRTREGNVCQNGTYTYGAWSTCPPDPCYHATTCNNGVPTACQNGYYLNNGECKSCGTGVTACGSDGKATSCAYGYYLVSNRNGMCVREDHTCKPCGGAMNSCNQSGTSCNPSALTCITGYYKKQVNSTTYSCESCGAHAISCTGYKQNVVCEAGYGASYYGICETCVSLMGAGTISCDSSGNATSCASGYQLKNTSVKWGPYTLTKKRCVKI